MAATFYIPSLATFCAKVRAAFNAELPGSDAFVWPNNVGPTAKVLAGSQYELMLRLDFVRRQAFALTAEGQWLDMHGAEYDLPRKPPQSATGLVPVTTTDAIAIPNGTQFVRSDGVLYAASAATGLSAAGTCQVAAIAVTPGKAGLAQPGTPLVMQTGPTGPGVVGATALVGPGGFVGGLDTEPDGAPFTSDLATYRGRILFRKRNPPMGGAPSDYVQWATSVPGVTRVFVERRYAGPGTVRVFPLFDDLFAATGGIPDAANVAAVQAALEPEAPAGAAVVAAAATPQLINPTIYGLTPNTSTVQQAVAAELRDAFRRLGAVSGSDYVVASMPYLATPQSFSLSWIDQAIANANGQQRHVLRAPTADVVIAPGALPVLGQIGLAYV